MHVTQAAMEELVNIVQDLALVAERLAVRAGHTDLAADAAIADSKLQAFKNDSYGQTDGVADTKEQT